MEIANVPEPVPDAGQVEVKIKININKSQLRIIRRQLCTDIFCFVRWDTQIWNLSDLNIFEY